MATQELNQGLAIKVMCQECSQVQEVFWSKVLESYPSCWYCGIDSSFFTKVGA